MASVDTVINQPSLDFIHTSHRDEIPETKNTDGQLSASLLDLPGEILSKILLNLPRRSLVACMHAHPLLGGIICDPHFVDTYIRCILGLSEAQDKDVKVGNLPTQRSRLMELWFLTHDTYSSMQNGTCATLARKDVFFHLDCFHHSILTWFVQSIMADVSFPDFDSNFPNCVDTLLNKQVDRLPKFVKGSLTRLLLAFPEIIEKTIMAPVLTLHKGIPTTLTHAWHDGLSAEVKDKCEPQYSLEIICGQTDESNQSAIFICFSSESWVVWTGCVSQFPGCRWETTRSQVVMLRSSSLSDIREACSSLGEFISEYARANENMNGQWKRSKLYPGLCYHFNRMSRKHFPYISLEVNLFHVFDKLPLQECLENCILESDCKYKFCDTDQKLAENWDETNTCNVGYFPLGETKRRVTICERNDPPGQQYIKLKHKCKKVLHLDKNHNSLKRTEESLQSDGLYLKEFKNYSDATLCGCERLQHSHKHELMPLPHAQKQYLLLKCGSAYQAEILKYACDPESHQILCPSCSKLWFPSPGSLASCIDQIKSMDSVPIDMWPCHLLANLTHKLKVKPTSI